MRHSRFLLGLIALCVPALTHAAAPTTLFSSLYAESASILHTTVPKEPVMGWIIDAMRDWGATGIVLTPDDVRAALEDREDTLCTGKVDTQGRPLSIARGPATAGEATCGGLIEAIRSLIRREASIEALGRDMRAITNGAELSIADEPGRPLSMTVQVGALHRMWAGGTGTSLLPLPQAALSHITQLENELLALSDIDPVVRRFHHGYFRDQRDGDPAESNIGTTIEARLAAIAQAVGITAHDVMRTGSYDVPPLSVPNVTLWIRRDDLGLLWTYPSSVTMGAQPLRGTYPVMKPGNEKLAYPFTQTTAPALPSTMTPLCARPLAREGYLCRPVPATAPACQPPSGSTTAITLIRCSYDTTTSAAGPPLCGDITSLLRTDDGRELQGAFDTAQLMSFPAADLSHACDPESGIIYPDTIGAHACYASLCLAQSMSGHSLIAGRSPVIIGETTAPFLAYKRPDPLLGLYGEIARPTPSALPASALPQMIASIERAYCERAGQGRMALPGHCAYDLVQRAESPPRTGAGFFSLVTDEHTMIDARQEDVLPFAGIIGARAALETFSVLQMHAMTTLASIVEQTASLLLELKRAPLTIDACPWTGPLISSPSSAP